MKLNVCVAVGDNRTAHCGVKDYAFQLASALAARGASVEVCAPADWGVKSVLKFREELRERRFDILHLQYPSIGHRKSLQPHIVGLLRAATRTVVTLHEYSNLPMPQRLSTHLFRWSADQLLFTTEREMARYGRTSVPSRIVPIGSNVPAFDTQVPRKPTILYFGQIRPQKGIEDFLELASRSLTTGQPFRYQVIGSVPQRKADYYRAIRATAHPDVEWTTDLSFEEIAQLLATSFAAYLPFPDGASYRRGSLLAALTNGLPTISTIGAATPREITDVILPAKGPVEALAHIKRLSKWPDGVRRLSYVGRRFAERFSWPEIARQHEQVYATALRQTGRAIGLTSNEFAPEANLVNTLSSRSEQ
jgi:glycosyltransferase involved in cell wall biosynthesis